MVVLPPLDTTLVITGKFCSSASASPTSFGVTPAVALQVDAQAAIAEDAVAEHPNAWRAGTLGDRHTPTAPLNAMTLPWPGAVPPTKTSGPCAITTPSLPLPRGSVPVTSVPMKFPCTKLSKTAESAPSPTTTPNTLFPEITLRSAGVAPPIREDAKPPLTPPARCNRRCSARRRPLSCWCRSGCPGRRAATPCPARVDRRCPRRSRRSGCEPQAWAHRLREILRRSRHHRPGLSSRRRPARRLSSR